MDVFDGEPYLGLLPRWVTRTAAWAVIVSIAFVPAARDWILGQATRHVMHQIQPVLEDLVPIGQPPKPAPMAPHR